ncbi:MAG: cyclic nucleotide-gated ion channel [Xanthobacteraceae bacterium]|nr:cyclic nucleotide-gated ion channel [Xanthobacteraceae bacterium]
MTRAQRISKLRHRIYEILEHGAISDHIGRFISRMLVLLIIVNLVAVALESVRELGDRFELLFFAIEAISLVVFTVEYVLRVWVAVEHERYLKLAPITMRLKYALSPSGLIDLLAVAPFWIALLTGTDLRVLLVFRMVRFLKLTRYSPGMRSLLDSLYAERRALFGCLVILIGATMVAASVMHLIEGAAQPDKFGTIPDAMWWAIVTLATVGYGDVTPITPLGKLFGSVVILAGLIIVALPVGIIATAFANEIHRRDFVVTWSMVARVPLFAELEAADIADISRLLRAQMVEAGTVIVRRGETGHSMYFVARGEVEIQLPHRQVRLGVGDFFGEVAVLRQSRRSATVTAVTRTNLLVLDAHDLEALMDREQRIADRIQEVMRSRIAREQVTPGGDIAAEEMEQGEAESESASKRKRRED